MSNTKDKKQTDPKNDAAIQPDPETLHTTDPQEEMKGPISSLVQGVKKEMEKKQVPEEDNDQKAK